MPIKTMNPFFSVIIPTRNRSELLREAICSVLNQTFEDFELLVVDDHSNDETCSTVSSFSDTRVKYLVNDRYRGGAGARNAGIFRAKGEWIAFLDDDDVWSPGKLELQEKKTREIDKDVGLIYGGYSFCKSGENGKLSRFVPKKKGWIQRDQLYRNHLGAVCTVVIRSQILKAIGGFDERFPALQDRELYVRVTESSMVDFVPDNIASIRRSHGENRISRDTSCKLIGNLLFIEKYGDLISQDLRLKHIWSSRVFLYAILQGDFKNAIQSFPMTLIGLFLDQKNLYRVIRRFFSYTLK